MRKCWRCYVHFKRPCLISNMFLRSQGLNHFSLVCFRCCKLWSSLWRQNHYSAKVCCFEIQNVSCIFAAHSLLRGYYLERICEVSVMLGHPTLNEHSDILKSVWQENISGWRRKHFFDHFPDIRKASTLKTWKSWQCLTRRHCQATSASVTSTTAMPRHSCLTLQTWVLNPTRARSDVATVLININAFCLNRLLGSVKN